MMSLRSFLSVGLLFLVSATNVFGGISKKQLATVPPTYREWLTRDVVYIITNDEQAAFLRLSTDAERDKFIEHFWEIRNPSPGSPNNSYNEQI